MWLLSNLDTRSLERDKGFTDSRYKIENEVNLKINVETTSEDIHVSNNNLEPNFFPNQNIPTDTKSNIRLIFLLIICQ